jgi:phosphoribosylamine---glycine ligase
MKTLIIGSGGREHALAWALQKANPDLKLYCAPGNAGIADLAQCVPIGIAEQDALVQFARSEAIDLTVVGPEAPLAEGLVDEFEARGLAIFGPSRAAARLEASKAFAKDFMARHRIPTANYRVADSADSALQLLRADFSHDEPVVIKADGLAAGKGVLVAESRAEAERALEDASSSSLGGSDRQKPFVIEEVLTGKESSVLVFSDGRDYAIMPPARDHKRIGENETGPNTGGMGSITDSSLLDEQTLSQVRTEIIERTLEGTRKDGFAFKGVLFFGLMLTNEGPKVLEYNVRFGDPETQAILVRLKSNLLDIFRATREGTLGNCRVEWSAGSSACVVLANAGYPGKYQTGAVIEGLYQAGLEPDVQIFHAGTTKSKSGEFLATGGRVLGVTAIGINLSAALSRCYSAVDKIKWDGMQYRRDIGRFHQRTSSAQ